MIWIYIYRNGSLPCAASSLCPPHHHHLLPHTRPLSGLNNIMCVQHIIFCLHLILWCFEETYYLDLLPYIYHIYICVPYMYFRVLPPNQPDQYRVIKRDSHM